MPVMTLKQVVLPAPLGPIRPRISPSSMWKLTSSRAVSPPNRRVTASRLSTGSGMGGPFLDLALFERVDLLLEMAGPDGSSRRQHALWAVDREQHQGESEHEHAVLLEPTEALREIGDDGSPHHHAPPVAGTADDDRRDEQDREQQRERLRADELDLA